MEYFKFLFRTRGIPNVLSRANAIFQRFGMTPRKSQKNLETLCRITKKFNCYPSLPATAIIVKRHPQVFKNLVKEGAEIAVHGYTHISYKDLSYEEQCSELEKAMNVFRMHDIPFLGFRCPYISWNEQTLKCVSSKNFLWDSNISILWDVLDGKDYDAERWEVLNKILSLIYQPYESDKFHSLPRLEENVIEIPVSLPDDEMLTDRLKVTDKKKLENIWSAILNKSYERGELFTLIIHPERVPIFKNIIENILVKARDLNPPIWVAKLGEIAKWWEEKSKYRFSFDKLTADTVKINLDRASKASVLLKNYDGDDFKKFPLTDYELVDDKSFVLKCKLIPIIGISPGFPSAAEKYLSEEGWLYHKSSERDKFSLYIDENENIDYSNERQISEFVERSQKPLIRIWRWPSGYKSALAITGDIDCLTLIDFFARLFKR